jgi:hypothetical protein
MKKLIFPLLLLPTILYAREEMLSNEELSRKVIATARGLQIERTVQNSSEAMECINNSRYQPNLDPTTRRTLAEEIETCFRRKIASKRPDDLQRLSTQLGLESYGLEASKDTKAITKFLTDKLYKSLTGVSADAADAKFSQRKIVNQKIFIELQTSQLSKSALYEISRFCFENLRYLDTNISTSSFADHWRSFLEGTQQNLGVDTVTDIGTGGFVNSIDVSSQERSYEDLFRSINGPRGSPPLNPNRMGAFFNACSNVIPQLCGVFEGNPSAPDGRGANACLAKGRLQEIRIALKKSEKIEEQMRTDFSGGTAVQLSASAQFYDREGGPNPENGLDNLTNVGSMDMLEGGKNTQDVDRAKRCEQNPALPECDNFIVIDQSRNRAEYDTDVQMRLRKEVEMARIKAIKQDRQKLRDYLEENGYLKLLADYDRDGPSRVDNIADEVGKAFDAKREATLKAINEKLGSRQLSETELGDRRDVLVTQNARDSQQERARMAQVVLFNNVITSYVTLYRDNGGRPEAVGRNVNAWRAEQRGLENANIDGELFQNLRQSADNAGGGNTQGNRVSGLTFLDTILGKREDSQGNQGSQSGRQP